MQVKKTAKKHDRMSGAKSMKLCSVALNIENCDY